MTIPELRLSPIVAGCCRMQAWGWSAAQRLDWIEACIDLGVTSFDHADIYGGHSVETLFGEALYVHLDAPTWHEIWSAGAGHEVP